MDTSKLMTFDNSMEFIEKLVKIGVDYHASDLHITPSKEQVYIRYRISGSLESFYGISLENYDKLINSIKVASFMAIDEHNHIQDGKMIFSIKNNGEDLVVNARVSILPTIHGENVVMRLLLSNSERLNINNLGFSDYNKKIISKIKNMEEGLVLLCGGTGSGKTTTLYSLLNEYNPFTNSIFTLEDPVEYTIKGYIQSEVKEKRIGSINTNYTFQEGLVGILRQDPDIIMIGEIRRKEEASICLEAANTGHLVMGSIHSNSSIGVITRLKKLGVEPYVLASSLKYIIFQKLVRQICPNCRESIQFSKNNFPIKFHKYLKKEIYDVYRVNPKGCSKCVKGYNGNTLISDIIENDDDIYNLILSGKGDVEIKEILISKGYIPSYVDALYKGLNGFLDIREAIAIE
ncbi:MAG: ATPase, T2SS/T4P/T4SS family [Candidatus Gracilibacteria bacterium]|nr:ATPase, T2SS/T4P/T4SS family [Candidatus Gracilibacteria bacterium]